VCLCYAYYNKENNTILLIIVSGRRIRDLAKNTGTKSIEEYTNGKSQIKLYLKSPSHSLSS
jgi:hypothetical protein